MSPTCVAVVPLEEPTEVKLEELTHVAAALQIQVLRDLAPIWNITAAVSAFARLEDVPPGYVPLLVTTNPLPLDRRGFHFAMGGLPFAVVEYRSAWTLAASHELLEMLCDPYGQRTVLAPSLADEKHAALKDAALKAPDSKAPAKPVIEGVGRYAKQGMVNYILEVCDACERSTYQINDILVSDFVTPNYYDKSNPRPPYSLLGRVGCPLEVLDGGYISWRTRLPDNVLYQASAPTSGATDVYAGPPADEAKTPVAARDLEIVNLVAGPSQLGIHAQRSRPFSTRRYTKPPYHPVQRTRPTAAKAGKTAGKIRADFKHLFDWLATENRTPPPSLDQIIDLVETLANNKVEYGRFSADPHGKLRELGINAIRNRPEVLPTQTEYGRILEYLKDQRKVAGIFGPDLIDPDVALWLAMHIG